MKHLKQTNTGCLRVTPLSNTYCKNYINIVALDTSVVPTRQKYSIKYILTVTFPVPTAFILINNSYRRKPIGTYRFRRRITDYGNHLNYIVFYTYCFSAVTEPPCVPWLCLEREGEREEREKPYEAVRLKTVMPEYILQSCKAPYVY